VTLIEFSGQESHGGSTQKRESAAVEAFPVLGEMSVPIKSADGTLDDLAFRYHDELVEIGAFDNLQVYQATGFAQPALEFRPLASGISGPINADSSFVTALV